MLSLQKPVKLPRDCMGIAKQGFGLQPALMEAKSLPGAKTYEFMPKRINGQKENPGP
jgi:hypothetical protein